MSTLIEGGIQSNSEVLESIEKKNILSLIDQGKLAPSTVEIFKYQKRKILQRVAIYYEDWYEICQEKFAEMSEESIHKFIRKFNVNIKRTIRKLLEQAGFRIISIKSYHVKDYADFGRSLVIVKMR